VRLRDYFPQDLHPPVAMQGNSWCTADCKMLSRRRFQEGPS